MFDPTSRYYGLPTLEMTDHRGRTVQIVTVPDAPRQQIRGEHLRRQGQRLARDDDRPEVTQPGVVDRKRQDFYVGLRTALPGVGFL